MLIESRRIFYLCGVDINCGKTFLLVSRLETNKNIDSQDIARLRLMNGRLKRKRKLFTKNRRDRFCLSLVRLKVNKKLEQKTSRLDHKLEFSNVFSKPMKN